MSPRVDVEDRAMAAELQLDGFRGRALDGDLFADDPQRLPLAVEADLVRVRRVQLLHVDVVLVGPHDREPPPDPLVVPDRHTEERRLG
jgi:hypothetical protein